MNNKVTIKDILTLKNKRKITMLTAYDYPLAAIIDKAGIDIILVGDSLANVVLGLESTTEVGMTEMLIAAKAVTRAAKRALVIADMPFEAYQKNPKQSAVNAKRFIEEAHCDAVKLEWFEDAVSITKNIIKEDIPVMGHIGLTPQTLEKIGGYKVQGKDIEGAKRLIDEAKKLEEAGCFAIVLECIPGEIAKVITEKVSIPTIGVGAGINCDGQVLVTYDILGLFNRFQPTFVKRFADIASLVEKAVIEFKLEVDTEKFPTQAHTFHTKIEEKELL